MPSDPYSLPPESSAERAGPASPLESHEAMMARLYSEHNQALIRFLMTRVAEV